MFKGCSGLDLIKEMHLQYPEFPILVVSMHDESLFAERAIYAGARGYITKQEATKKIFHAIRKVLTGEIIGVRKLPQKSSRRWQAAVMRAASHPLSVWPTVNCKCSG